MSEPQLPLQQDGPFVGMLANSRVNTPQGFVTFLKNYFVRDGEIVGRRGLSTMGSAIGGGNDVQGIVQWQMLNGTQYTCAFANGDLYIYDWTGGTWTAYDISAAGGPTVSTTGDINCAISRGRLICTDGVNKPFMITGPVAGITYTELTLAPVSHRVGVYYDKVFFWDINGYENEFQWSDEGNPAAGYSGSDQAWEFAQTDAGRILGMAPLNERNVILKEDSATMLMGAVDENFSTLAVREGLSETEGTVAGGSVAILDGDVYCISVNGPRIIQKGQVYLSLHDVQGVDYLRDIWSDVNLAQLSSSLVWVDTEAKMIGWLIPKAGETTLYRSLVFQQETASWTTFEFAGLSITACGTVEDGSGQTWVLFGDADGLVYKYRIGASVYSDKTTTAIERIIRGRLMGGEQPSLQKRLLETQFQFYLDTDFHGEIRPYVDGTVLAGKRFGLHDITGKKVYRRGFNSVGYRVGWEIFSNDLAQTLTLTSALTFMGAVGMTSNWH